MTGDPPDDATNDEPADGTPAEVPEATPPSPDGRRGAAPTSSPQRAGHRARLWRLLFLAIVVLGLIVIVVGVVSDPPPAGASPQRSVGI